MLHQLLNVAEVLWAEQVQSDALEEERDITGALRAWELELYRPFTVPARATAGSSRVGPGVSQFMPLPPPPPRPVERSA